MDSCSIKRATVRLRTPNPLFEKWLMEWHLQEGDNVTIYSKALESLKKYPLVLKTGLECIILEHFDKNLCIKLNKKLNEHNGKEEKQDSCNSTKNECNAINSININDIEKINAEKTSNSLKPTKRKKDEVKAATSSSPKASPESKKVRPYVPAKKSAAYGLLLALINREYENDYAGFMTKSELLIAAQKHSNVSFSKPQPGTYYSGWSSMSHLITKGLVLKTSNPAKFSLTESGRELALKLKNGFSEANSQDDHSQNEAPVLALTSAEELVAPAKPRGRKKKEDSDTCGSAGTSSQSQEFETEEMIFLPSTFDIILLVDTAETLGAAKRNQDEAIIALKSTGIKFEVRHLKVGDYVWIARDPIGREIVLPYIVERKRMDDLGASIKDGRFHEQKFRLKQCGLQNKIYLVEDSGSDRNGLPMNNIMQAISNTMVCDKFSVKMTRSLLESMRYLATVTNLLTEKFQKKTLFSCKKEDLSETINLEDDIVSLLSFADFSHNMAKVRAFTPREMFAKQLVQMHGLSGDKAWVITEHYPTPRELIEGFLFDDAEKKISQLTSGLMERKVGPQIAAKLKVFYTKEDFT